MIGFIALVDELEGGITDGYNSDGYVILPVVGITWGRYIIFAYGGRVGGLVCYLAYDGWVYEWVGGYNMGWVCQPAHLPERHHPHGATQALQQYTVKPQQ